MTTALAPSSPSPPSPASAGAVPVAVVVDDSISALTQMLNLLRTIGTCSPIGFTDPREGLDYCLSHDVALVVVDYEMPGMDGVHFIESFREDRRRSLVPVVMVTSTGDKDVRYLALQVGATDFLSKPVDPVEFIARMNNQLSASQAHKTLAGLSQWLTDEVRKVSAVVRQSPVSVMITDRAGRIDYVNQAFMAVTGLSAEEAIGRTPAELRVETYEAEERAAITATIEAGQEWRGTTQGHRKDGSGYWEAARIFAIRDEAGTLTNLVSINEDITLHKEYEARIAWQNNYDALTGLPNRMLAIDRLDQAIAHAECNGDTVAVILIDIDRFKLVIETMGHAAGDELLRQVARRLQESEMRGDATLARIGNDDFAVIIPQIKESYALQPTLDQIRQCFALPFMIHDSEIFTSASLGVSLYPTDGLSPSDLLRNAHTAMTTAQSEERGGWRFFTSELDSGVRHRMQAESRLRHALANGELSLNYHPLVNIETGEMLAAEALLRWRNADLGPVSPDLFIPIAEETGLIVPIGAWVFEQVCRDMAEWTSAGLPPLRVAVNVSSRQLADDSLIGIVSGALAANGLGPERLEIEVTERLLLDRSPRTLALLNELRAMGLRFSIDDFGTGYSSMSYLTSFPFDVLKVDRSFVSKVTERKQDAALTQAIIAMARSLDLEVVAEGVETQEQLDFLRRTGCTFAQGYLFSRPMPASALAERLAGRGSFTSSPRPKPNSASAH